MQGCAEDKVVLPTEDWALFPAHLPVLRYQQSCVSQVLPVCFFCLLHSDPESTFLKHLQDKNLALKSCFFKYLKHFRHAKWRQINLRSCQIRKKTVLIIYLIQTYFGCSFTLQGFFGVFGLSLGKLWPTVPVVFWPHFHTYLDLHIWNLKWISKHSLNLKWHILLISSWWYLICAQY